ncbi:MAG: hypothetical protein JWQ65_2586, partial [Devosia sp.]|nr:hypothetical protein [Devosia sp.]
MAVLDRTGEWRCFGWPRSIGRLTGVATLALLAAITPSQAQGVTFTDDIYPGSVMDGPNWNGSFVIVGNSAPGAVNVDGSGQVVINGLTYLGFDPNVTGTVTVTGYGSSWDNYSSFTVGNYGTGILNVENGGRTFSGLSYLGYQSGSTGTAMVTGAGSWLSGELHVGYWGTAILNIEDSGHVVAWSSADLGYQSDGTGTATVKGAGSSWEILGALHIGEQGIGVLNVEDAGYASSYDGYLGFASGSTGTATVTGAGSSWTTSSLTVGNGGTGTLTIADGGLVSVGGARQVDVGLLSGSIGTINVGAAAGDAAAAAGTLDAGTLDFGDGTGTLVFNHTGMPDGSALRFDPGISGVGAIEHLAGTTILTGDGSGFGGTTTVSGGTLIVGSAGTGSLGGMIDVLSGATLGGTGALGTTTIAAGGTHTPGNSIGTQTINGNYINHGTLVVEANPSSADKLVVNGAVDIAGANLNLLLTPTSVADWDIAHNPFSYTIIA